MRAPQSMQFCRGVSLVELMVSLTLGMLLMVVIGNAYVAARQAFRTMDALSRMQENARFIFEAMAYDLRMAGFTGCSYSSSDVANVLNNATDWDKNLFGRPLVGYEEGVSAYPGDVAGNVLRGDALTVLRASSPEYIVASHNPAAAQFQLTANHAIKQGEILVVTNCSNTAVFQMTNVNSSDTIDTIVHNTGAATSPGNYTKGFGIPLGGSSPFVPWANCLAPPAPIPPYCGDVNGTAYAFAPNPPAPNPRILRLSAVTYYIRTNSVGEPALYRQKLGASGGDATTTAEELVEGVENMQITYGEDTSSDQAVDVYATANAVSNWTNVLSVRVSLVLVSRRDESITTQPQPYTYNGATTTPTDRLIRKIVTSTISLRNRL